jgi:glycosyltransferase involved in cell wall biosynthesis
MNRFSFLKKSIPGYLDNPNIAAVVICDETGEDVKQIESQSWGKHPKLRLHTNPKRLGIYHNKRKCMDISPTEWVALLDSDNIFPEEFFETIQDLWSTQGANPSMLYASGDVVRVFMKTGESEDRTAHFAGKVITKETWNTILQTPAWNFLLNDGNWIGHRSLLEAWPSNIRDEQVRATDAIFVLKNLIQKGWSYFIVPDLKYIHTVHDGSEWLRTEAESSYLLGSTNWRV